MLIRLEIYLKNSMIKTYYKKLRKMTLIILRFILVVKINLMMMLLLLRLTLRLIVKKEHLLS